MWELRQAGFELRLAFEDDRRNVEMFRGDGIPVPLRALRLLRLSLRSGSTNRTNRPHVASAQGRGADRNARCEPESRPIAIEKALACRKES